jgi:hypothetical protein
LMPLLAMRVGFCGRSMKGRINRSSGGWMLPWMSRN